VPYKDPERKAAWEKTHRAMRTEERLAMLKTARAYDKDVPPVDVSERMARGGQEREAAWHEYEASMGVGNPTQDDDVLNLIRRRR
jgi:hypothetical protein